GISGSRSCTNLYMVCVRTCMQPPGKPDGAIGTAWFVRSTDTQRLSVTGAAAHMSLHLNRQCQRADAPPRPVFIRDTGFRLRETQTGSGRRPAPSVKGHICRRVPTVNTLFFRNATRCRDAFPHRNDSPSKG